MAGARSNLLVFRLLRRLVLLLALALPASPALAQVSNQYTNSTSAAIDDLTCGTGNIVTRTFTVGSNVAITDVNIGVALLHTYRSDLQITLTSPAGTVVTLANGQGGSGDNLSDLFDDSALLSITGHGLLLSDSTGSVPPYSHSFRPESPLSAFNGQYSAGSWTLTICDGIAQDVGTFTRSDLYITGTTLADLSLAMARSSATPTYGTTYTYTLTASSAATSSATATGVTVSDLLPSGATFVSSAGTGTYSSATGVWNVGSLAAGGSASLTITATASAPVGTVVTNTAQITASSQPDPDSTVNNGNTSEDDYASAAITVGANTINCPAGSSTTGSGYAASGTSSLRGQIFWLDWSCGSTSVFNKGATVNKSWSAGDGLALTAQITGISADVSPYTVGTWAGDTLQLLHAGVNPIGLSNTAGGTAPNLTLALAATLNAVPVALRYVLADAEDGSPGESIAATTNGSAWQLLESSGSITTSIAGSSVTISDPANGGGGSASLETSATNLSLGVTLTGSGITAAAFGFYAPYDFSDAPLTGTSYGSASHRTLPGLRMGNGFTTENSAYDSATASADSDDGVTLPSLFRSVATSISVPVTGPGRLSAWIDFNGDGDFADSGEQIASSVTDGGSGDGDAAANGTIQLALTPPANATTSPTIARFRFSSNSGIASSGLAGYGEVEDYQLTVIYPTLAVTKSSSVISDPANGTTLPKAIPGAKIRYCLLVTNTGNSSASTVLLADTLPASTSYVAGSLRSGTSCAGATTIEDDGATGADESDPVGASASGNAVSGSAPTLAVGASVALTYEAIVQ